MQRTLFSGPGCISDRLILLLLFFPQLLRGDSSIPPGRPRDTRCHRSNMTHTSPTVFWLAACPHLVLEKSSLHISRRHIFLLLNAISPCSEQAEYPRRMAGTREPAL